MIAFLHREHCGLVVLLLLFGFTLVESIALPAAPCGDAEFYYEPNRTRLRCNDYCPPAVSDDRNVEFCRRNCPECFESLLAQYSYEAEATPTVFDVTAADSVISQTGAPAVHCRRTYFYYPKRGIVPCTRVCQTTNNFCAANCPDYHSCLAKRKVAGDVTASSSTTGITVTFSSYRAVTNYSSTAANDFKAASVAENRKDCTTSVLVTNVAWVGGICFVAVCVIVYLVLTRRRSTVTTNQPERGDKVEEFPMLIPPTETAQSGTRNNQDGGETGSVPPTLCTKNDQRQDEILQGSDIDGQTTVKSPESAHEGQLCSEPSVVENGASLSSHSHRISLRSDQPDSNE